MSYRVLTQLYDELYPVASGVLDNWVNPFTGSGSAITGLSLFKPGETGWHEDFLKSLYLIDYYSTFIVNTSGQTDRSGIPFTPHLVGDSVRDRLDYTWNIVRRAQGGGVGGNIQTAINAWGAQLDGSGAILGDQYLSYSTVGLGLGQLPELVNYAWDGMSYWDNYDAGLVTIFNLPVGGFTHPDTGLTGLSVDLSADPDIDGFAAPLTASGLYNTELSGTDTYLVSPLESASYYDDSLAGIDNLGLASLWANNTLDGVLNDGSGTIVNPLNPTWIAEDNLREFTLTVNHLGASGNLNTLSRDIAQKTMVYIARRLNELHRLVYGSIPGFQIDIPTASGALPFDFTLENGSSITPSGGAAWPVATNPFASGELSPSGGALLYSPDIPDFHWRKLVNAMDASLTDASDYGAMPWLLSQLRYMRYRMYQLVGQNSRQKGGRLWRATMPVSGSSYATFDDLPKAGDPWFATTVTRDESDGVFYVVADQTWYYWDALTSAWRVAWSVDPTTASGTFPNVPDAFGVLVGKGVAAMPSYKEEWDAASFRTYYEGPPASGEWHVAPGADVYSRVVEAVYGASLGTKVVDQTVVDEFGVNLTGWTDSGNQNLLGFDPDNPLTQFVTEFKNTHTRLGSLTAASFMPGKTMADVQANDFLETILYAVAPSGEFGSGTFIRELAAILEWHLQSIDELETGDIDVANRPNNTLAEALTLGFYNKMSFVPYVTGDGSPAGQLHPTPSGLGVRFIGPHQMTFVDDNDPGFYGGVRLTYFDEEAT